MVKKKVKEVVEEVEVSSKKDIEKENKTLFWFFIVVGIVFASVLIPYFWIQSGKTFEFGEISWVVEDYENLRIFHGRFLSFTNPDLHYNIFLRTDPRVNDVEVLGKLDSFKYGGIISLSPEVDACRGDLSRVMLDLGAFLNQGVGVGVIESASSDEDFANQTNRKFVSCENTLDRTVVVVEIGEGGVVQDEENLNCYTIYARNCEDSSAVEKFMTRTVSDFRDSYPIEE
jgi:hypothetical protein